MFIGAGWLVFNLALFWMYFSSQPKALVGDEVMYNNAALSLLQGVDVTLHHIWPPAQKWLLAGLHGIFGTGLMGVVLVQVAAFLACGWLVYRIWLHVDQATAARWAVALFLVNPGTLAYAYWLWPEVPHLLCLLAAVCLLLESHRGGVMRPVIAGVLVGIALLFKSLLAAFWPLMLVIFLVRWSGGRITVAWRYLIGFIVGLAVVTTPVLWQGWRETGKPVIADSSIYNLYVGLIDLRRSDYIDEHGGTTMAAFIHGGETPQQRNAIYSEKIRDIVRQRGVTEIFLEQLGRQYFRLFNAKTLLVSQFPGAVCAGQLSAYPDSVLIAPMRWITQAMHTGILVLAAFGLAFWRRWTHPLMLCIGAFFAYQLALYLGLHVMQRYLFPFLPFLCGFAGSALAKMTNPSIPTAQSTMVITQGRLIVGSALAVLLLVLAWLGPWLDGPTCAPA